jgi:hypothetical protein
MTMMTVLRQAQAPQSVEHHALARLAVDNEAVSMILFARQHAKPTLVGLAGGQAIVKPQEAGDEGHSFEGLYDTAITIKEYRAMAEHKVTAVENLPLSAYEVIVAVQAEQVPQVKVRLHAKSDVDVLTRLKRLVNVNAEFREQLVTHLVKHLLDADGVTLLYGSAYRSADTAEPGASDWGFVDD